MKFSYIYNITSFNYNNHLHYCFILSLFPNALSCMCVHALSCGLHMCADVYLCVKAREQIHVSFFGHFPPCCFKTGLFLGLELTGLVRLLSNSSQGLSYLCSPMTINTCLIPNSSMWVMGIRLRFLCENYFTN